MTFPQLLSIRCHIWAFELIFNLLLFQANDTSLICAGGQASITELGSSVAASGTIFRLYAARHSIERWQWLEILFGALSLNGCALGIEARVHPEYTPDTYIFLALACDRLARDQMWLIMCRWCRVLRATLRSTITQRACRWVEIQGVHLSSRLRALVSI